MNNLDHSDKPNQRSFDLTTPQAFGPIQYSGNIKTSSSDFFVRELMEVPDENVGEHVYLWIRKEGQNTEYVAKLIARFAKVRSMDVGFSGLKDRWAITEQWFSVYLGNKPEPDWEQFKQEGIEILACRRCPKKLRRGEHNSNYFKLIVRELSALNSDQSSFSSADIELLEERLEQIKSEGFPNYFGAQRFGFDASNLYRAESYFKQEIKASRSQRSYYLSAARSYLFNLMLTRAVDTGDWNIVGAKGALYGDPQDGVDELSPIEQEICDDFPVLVEGLRMNRLKMERRDFCIRASDFVWNFDDNVLTLEFSLPTGVFATTLLSELLSVHDVSQARKNNIERNS